MGNGSGVSIKRIAFDAHTRPRRINESDALCYHSLHIRCVRLGRALQPLQRLGDLCLARYGLLALFFFFLDDFLWRARDEI